MADRWKHIAWNGIRFKAPAEWEVGQIDSRHLILEREAEPVMEVKWGSVKGAFSHKAHLKRLIAFAFGFRKPSSRSRSGLLTRATSISLSNVTRRSFDPSLPPSQELK